MLIRIKYPGTTLSNTILILFISLSTKAQEMNLEKQVKVIRQGFVNTVIADLSTVAGDNITHLRGIELGDNGGFTTQNPNVLSNLQMTKDSYMSIVCAQRNLYRQLPLNPAEFYKSTNGTYNYQVNTGFTDVISFAAKKDISNPDGSKRGLIVINQIGGTPELGPTSNDGSWPEVSSYNFPSIFNFDPNFQPANYSTISRSPILYDNRTLQGDADYVPLPAASQKEIFATLFKQWAVKCDEKVQSDLNDPTFRSIWIGHQEPGHTLGIPAPGPDQVTTTLAQAMTNISRYIQYWKPIYSYIQDNGGLVGGTQMNMGHFEAFDMMVDTLLKYNVKLDYLTFQFYKEWANKVAYDAVVDALKKYQSAPGGNPYARIIINRGLWWENVKTEMTTTQSMNYAKGVNYFLEGEKLCMDNTKYIYASIFDCYNTTSSSMVMKVESWLNTIQPNIPRHTLTNLPVDCNGFLLADSNSLNLAIWNLGGDVESINLTVNAFKDGSWGNLAGQPYVLNTGENTTFSTTTLLTFTLTSPISLTIPAYGFILLKIKALPNSTALSKLSTDSNIRLFPNPASNKITIQKSDPETIVESIYNIAGLQMLKLINSQIEIDISTFPKGFYLLKSNSNGKIENTVFLKK